MKQFLKKIKERLLLALIAIPVAFLLSEFVPDKTVDLLFKGLGAVGAVAVLYLWWQAHRVTRELDESRARAEEWKRKIRSLTERTESPDGDMTFDEFCDFEEDEVLAGLVRELEKLPLGERSLKKAYEIVNGKASKAAGNTHTSASSPRE